MSSQAFNQTQSAKTPTITPVQGGLLQRKCATCGNHTVAGGECTDCKKRKPLGLQTKLAINEPGDRYEQEADRVADQVMAMPAHSTISRSPLNIQRFSGASSGQGNEVPESVHRVLASPGRPLNPALRENMEGSIGYDFSRVKVHTGATAEQSSRDVNAHAYTVGYDIVFGRGHFEPRTTEGRHLIAHELTHVVQQGGNSKIIQRQEEDLPDLSRPGDTPTRRDVPTPDVVIDPTSLSEPSCPRTPTRLGNLSPTPPCNEEGEDIDGDVFQFCSDSDVFSDPTDLNRLRALVSGQPSGTSFVVHAYASVEGPGTTQNATQYNRNLSCHRLNRMIREILNLGVQEQQIDAVSKGPTERFGTGAAARPRNRVAVIESNPPEQAQRADATGMTMSQIRDAAKQRIQSGDYPLAADAYFARWSCGRWRTLAEAVARTNVLIEGAETSISASDELGTTAATGANTIVISRRIADSTDPIGCAANRITDLTFHHFSRPVLSNFEDQHRGGMHLVHLARFPECRISLDPLNSRFEVRSRPQPVDPFIGFVPRCADQPLPGPLAGQRGPATMERPPTFTVSSLGLTSGTSGSAVPSPPSNPLTVGVEPDSPFEVTARVDAVGAPASIANFDIGFVQTVMAENWINTHVDGRRERRRFPLPLRDGPKRSDPASEPPWFDTNSKATAALGTNQVKLTDAPNFRAFRFLPDLSSSLFIQSIQVPRPGGGRDVTLERPTFQPRLGPVLPANTPQADIEAEQRRRELLANNVPNHGRRAIGFNTWVVARRRNPLAPATHGDTQFLGGLRLVFNLTANWSSTASGSITGAGSFNMTSRPATSSDADAVMLRGVTPLDFVGPGGVPLFAEFLDIDPPLPRVQAGGLDRNAYFNAVRQIVQPHRTGPFMRGEVIVRINIEVATGRVILDTPDLQRGAIRVLDTSSSLADNPETREFARAVFPEIRKLVVASGAFTSEPQTGTMPVAIRLQQRGIPGAP